MDVETIAKLEVVERENGDLRPHRLSLWADFLCNSMLAWLGLVLIGPFGFAGLRRRSLRLERTYLELKIRRVEARHERLGGAVWLP